MAKIKAEVHDLSYSPDHYAVMANDIVKGKQSMTLQQARVLRLMITQVAKDDTDYRTYTCRIKDLARFLGIDSSNLYRDIQDFCLGMLDLKVQVGTGNPRSPWRAWHWISMASYDGNGAITLRLSDEIKPYVLALDRWFTRYQLGNILSMKSFYSIRLYEILKCEDNKTKNEKGYHEFTIQEFREMLGCEKKYRQIGQLKQRVIEPASREINEKTDMQVNVEYVKTGRAITSVRFYVRDKPETQLPGQTELSLK